MFFTHKTAYELRISYWSSYVCSSDLAYPGPSTTEQQPSRPLVPKDWWEADYPPVSEQPEAIRPVVREDFAQQRISNEARRQREAQQRKQQETEIGRASCRERVCQYV